MASVNPRAIFSQNNSSLCATAVACGQRRQKTFSGKPCALRRRANGENRRKMRYRYGRDGGSRKEENAMAITTPNAKGHERLAALASRYVDVASLPWVPTRF